MARTVNKHMDDCIACGLCVQVCPAVFAEAEDKPIVANNIEHNDFWIDFVREVNREGKTVWEWHAFDHIGKGPKALDINYTLPKPVGPVYWNFDWTHFNTVGYNPATDQVILNSRNFSEFYFINHKTGEIVYRWGNPSAYGGGKAPSTNITITAPSAP